MTERNQKTIPVGENAAPEERSVGATKKAPKTAQKQVAKRKDDATDTVTREKVTVFATVDAEMLKAINAAADAHGHLLVRMDEKVIDDFLSARNAPTPEQTEVKNVAEFINDDNHRAKAESDAKRLYMYLSGNAPIEQASGKRFTRRHIVKATTLSNSQAVAMLTLLEAFGFVRYTGGKQDEFEFEFSAAEIHRAVRRQALAILTEAAKDFVRYKALLAQDTSLTKKARDHEIAALRAEFRALLNADNDK